MKQTPARTAVLAALLLLAGMGVTAWWGVPLDIIIEYVRVNVVNLKPHDLGMVETSLQGLVGVLAAFTAFVLIYPPLFRGAACIVKERKADTLEPLLLTDLEPREILRQKWMGICLCDWPIAQVFLAIAVPACLTYLFPWRVVLSGWIAVAVLPLITAFMAVLGVLISTEAKTPLRANVMAGLMVFLTMIPVGALSGNVAKMHRYHGIAGSVGVAVLYMAGLVTLTVLIFRFAARRFANVREHARN
jgi:hypothetical protein